MSYRTQTLPISEARERLHEISDDLRTQALDRVDIRFYGKTAISCVRTAELEETKMLAAEFRSLARRLDLDPDAPEDWAQKIVFMVRSTPAKTPAEVVP